ncbi:MAG TPA: IS110 family transposase [Sporichthyaceae bacterium]|jgi:transposase
MSLTDPEPTASVRPAPTGGVDWASTDHAVCVVGPEGEVLARFAVNHTRAGLRSMVAKLIAAGVERVGIERGDGPAVDALRQAGLSVYVVPPGQVKNLRSRYGSAGNKDDRFDAYVLADVVRTDARRLRPLEYDTTAGVALRQSVRARRDLVAHRVAVANQLRAHLQLVFPGVVGLFADLDSAVSLTFLARFPSAEKAAWLSAKRLAAWLSSVGYCGRTDPAELHARLAAAPAAKTDTDHATAAAVTTAYLAVLSTLNAQIQALAQRIGEQLVLHPDEAIFTSLPRSGQVRAARLLAEIGDARGRFPTADSLACLAGVAPSTRQSGKTTLVGFRWSADRQLRDAVCDFAADSRHANPWAADLYNRARARGHDHPHAVRILARAWIDVIWRCWQDNKPYNPDEHRALQHVLNRTQPTAA